MKSLTSDTINTLSVHRNVNFRFNFNYAKVERKLITFRKKNSSFPDNLKKELDEKFSITQKDCHHTEFHPCVNVVLQKNSSDLLETCMKNITLQLRRTSSTKVKVINGTTQK